MVICLTTLNSTVSVPIIKDKTKHIGDKNNYSPIGLSNIFTNIFEYVLMNRMETFLSTTCNQFGFKAEHGTYHVILLSKLVKFGVPLYIVRIVALWYSSQLYFVSWFYT